MAIGVAAAPLAGRAQVLRELDPIDLRYVIRLEAAPDSIGSATVSFRPVDTPRGRRLQVKAVIDIGVGKDPVVPYHEEATLSCDAKGLEKFESARTFGEQDEKYLGVRTGDKYAVTATVNGKTAQTTQSGQVSRSNLGLFCGGFLDMPLNEGNVIIEYPMLLPARGELEYRQRVRTASVRIATADAPITVIHTRLLAKRGKGNDVWNLDDEHEPLIRMIDHEDFGTVIYSLAERDGEDVSGWATAVTDAFPQ